MRFKTDWVSLIVGSKLPFLLCFTLYLRAIFLVQAPRGAYIWRGDLTEGFLRYRFGGLYLEGLIHGGAYFWNFTVFSMLLQPQQFCTKTRGASQLP